MPLELEEQYEKIYVFCYFRRERQTVDIDSMAKLSNETADNLETVIAVRNAVLNLNPEEQEIVLLRFINELGIGEIAEYLDVSRFAVYRKLKGIEKRLKTVLKKEDFYG